MNRSEPERAGGPASSPGTRGVRALADVTSEWRQRDRAELDTAAEQVGQGLHALGLDHR